MNIFVVLCVFLVIIMLSMIFFYSFGRFLSWISDEDDDFAFFASWFFSMIGFGVVLTILLYEKGVL